MANNDVIAIIVVLETNQTNDIFNVDRFRENLIYEEITDFDKLEKCPTL